MITTKTNRNFPINLGLAWLGYKFPINLTNLTARLPTHDVTLGFRLGCIGGHKYLVSFTITIPERGHDLMATDNIFQAGI
jgi:hypothetical protein